MAEKGKEEVRASNMVQDAIDTVDVTKYNLNIFDEVYAKLHAMVSKKEFNAGNWITLVTLAMEMVETLPHLSGKDKRALVIDLITKLVTEIPMADKDRALIQTILSSSLPAIIDAICDSSLGVYAINLVQEAHAECKGCFASCKGGDKKTRQKRK